MKNIVGSTTIKGAKSGRRVPSLLNLKSSNPGLGADDNISGDAALLSQRDLNPFLSSAALFETRPSPQLGFELQCP